MALFWRIVWYNIRQHQGGFMGKLGLFLGRLAVAAIYIVIAVLFGNVATVWLVFLAVGVFVSAVATNLMEDCNGVVRIVVFCLGAGLLIVPAVVRNIMMFTGEGSVFDAALFATCCGLVFMMWLECGNSDYVHFYIDIAAFYASLLISFLVSAIGNVNAAAILLFIVGIIFLFILLIKRIRNGSAFE